MLALRASCLASILFAISAGILGIAKAKADFDGFRGSGQAVMNSEIESEAKDNATGQVGREQKAPSDDCCGSE